MNIIICIDNNKGMLFNGRRQSRDSAVLTDIIESVGSKGLRLSPFSEKLFRGFPERLIVDDGFLENAEKGDFCFAENAELSGSCERIESLIVYNWNRDYPADFYCDLDFSLFELSEERDFSGSSHEKITKQIFIKR